MRAGRGKNSHENMPAENERIDELEETAGDEQGVEGDEEKSYGLQGYDLVTHNMEKRKAERERKQNRVHPAFIIIIVFVLLFCLYKFSKSSYFRIMNIEIEGNSYFTEEEILNMSHASLGGNIIYEANKSKIIEFLETNPYIEDAKVSRQLPDTLVITVVERTQIAGIVYDDSYLIIDDEGVLLRKTDTQPKLTLISGLVVTKIELGSKIETEDDELFEEALALITSMENGDLFFKKITMGSTIVKAYIYDSLVCEGTVDNLCNAIDQNMLQQVINELFDDGIERGTITVREDSASFTPTI